MEQTIEPPIAIEPPTGAEFDKVTESFKNISGYPKIFHIGHPLTRPLIAQRVRVEEKVDGSQFSMRKMADGQVWIKSKAVEQDPYNPNGMFSLGAQTALSLDLRPGWTYRGEYLQKPRHNTLSYSRVPAKYVIIYDIERDYSDFLTIEERKEECDRLGLECVPTLFEGVLNDAKQFNEVMNTVSVLGGEQIEGVVIKPYHSDVFGPDGKLVMAKYVREEFKERNHKNWKTVVNPGKNMIVEKLIALYDNDNVKRKALQRLREEGALEDHPRDIPKIVKSIHTDVAEEWEEEIKEALYKWALPQIQKGVCRGVPEWYKDLLLQEAFVDVVPVETIQ